MKVYMLHEARLGALPLEIKELRCFDSDLLILPAGVRGRSVYLEGPKEIFVEWLSKFNGVWLGEGQPFEERFGIYHIMWANDSWPTPEDKIGFVYKEGN